MPQLKVSSRPTAPRSAKPGNHSADKSEVRYTVGLAQGLANQVERYARTVDTSRSKAIAALVRLGLENQEIRKREFFKNLRANLNSTVPGSENQLVDEFRALILGR